MLVQINLKIFDNSRKLIIKIYNDTIIKSLISLFINYQIFVDLFLQARLIDKMDWRASQPFDHLLPKELQWSSSSKIGFCGDWFDFNCCGGVESAMNSSIRLAKLLDWNWLLIFLLMIRLLTEHYLL